MLITIGRIDKADFPDLMLESVNVKIDTGAYTSSIHSSDIKEMIINDEKYIKFKLLDSSHSQYNNKEYFVKNYRYKRVKNSFGQSEQRFVIQTFILLFGKKYKIDLSLSARGEMKYPILLGRKLLNRKFVVDTTKKNLSYKLKQKSQFENNI